MTSPPPPTTTQVLERLMRLAGPGASAHLVTNALESRSELLRYLRRRFTHGKAAGTRELINRLGDVFAGEAGNPAGGAAPVLDLVRTPGIAIYGMFTAEIGIGQSARRSALSLATTDVRTSRHNIADAVLFENAVEFNASSDLASSFDTALIHLNPDTLLHVLRRFPLEVLVGTRRIGVWHWELPVFPVRWAKAFEHVDELWAPSAFVARSIRQASDIPVRLVPHAVPSAPMSQKLAREAFGLPASAFVFLTIFDSNSFPTRKNPLGVIRAFQDAFPDRGSDHLLIVKCHGRGRRGACFEEILRLARGDRRLVLLDQAFSEQRTRLLQAACDVYVSLHRSEGYGLNLLECMALGKLAIGTAFSGNLQFMTAENSVLIPYSMRQVGEGEYLFGEGQWWAEPEQDAAVDALRWAAAGGGGVQARAAQGRSDVTSAYSFEAIGRVGVAAWRGHLKPY